jgi:hypothetical protein
MGNWTAETILSQSNAVGNIGALQRAYNILTGATVYDNVPSEKIWRAKIQHLTGGNSVTTTELFNNTGVDFTVHRLGVGILQVTGSGMFTTMSALNAQLGYPFSGSSRAMQAVFCRSGSNDVACLETYNVSGSCTEVYDDLYAEVISHA